MFDKEFFNSPLYLLILFAILAGFIWYDRVKTKRRKQHEQMEADALANMSPETRALHMEAERTMANVKFQWAIWFINAIVSFSLIYWFLK